MRDIKIHFSGNDSLRQKVWRMQKDLEAGRHREEICDMSYPLNAILALYGMQMAQNMDHNEVRCILQLAHESVDEWYPTRTTRLDSKAVIDMNDILVAKQKFQEPASAFQSLDSCNFNLTNISLPGRESPRLKDESSCFVATATYGSPNHETVLLLRSFRDDVLANYRIGRLFISAYWIIGPRLARFINHYPISKKAIAPLLRVVARCVKKV